MTRADYSVAPPRRSAQPPITSSTRSTATGLNRRRLLDDAEIEVPKTKVKLSHHHYRSHQEPEVPDSEEESEGAKTVDSGEDSDGSESRVSPNEDQEQYEEIISLPSNIRKGGKEKSKAKVLAESSDEDDEEGKCCLHFFLLFIIN